VAEPEVVDAYTTEIILPLNECLFSDLPREYAIFSLFIPSILRRFELALVAKELNLTLLKPVGFQNLDLVQRAITHNSAREEEHYQRLEFLGDCILKMFTSVQLMVDHHTWPEGYLTQEKGIRVSNTTLDAITRRIGLDKFIITDPFTGAKWRPLYVHELLAKTELAPEVSRSSKTLADVIESLIGAAYIEDGLTGALRCTTIFFPKDQWLNLEKAMQHLNSTATEKSSSPLHLEGLEQLLNYNFKNPQLLLEAMTHASFNSYGTATALSYQRMEFLGDAILDFLVVRRLFTHKTELEHLTMHTLRTAMVNSGILGYLCMTHSIDEVRHDPIMDEGTGTINIEETKVKRWMWQFMRHTSQAISAAQTAAVDRLNEVSNSLATDLKSGTRYPWSTLAHFAPDKFFSDLIESTIGAIFVDSCGSLSACDAFLHDLGLWTLLDRALEDGVDCLHPKEKLGQLAVEKTVEYQNRFEAGVYFCKVKVGNKQMGEEVKGYSRMDVETAAAVQAARILENEDEDKEL
jgi:dsRNA-specific ribonuclease